MQQDRSAALACVDTALRSKQPFRFSVTFNGVDSQITFGLVRTPDGRLLQVVHDSDTSGGHRLFPKRAIWEMPCPSPEPITVEPGAYERAPFRCESSGA